MCEARAGRSVGMDGDKGMWVGVGSGILVGVRHDARQAPVSSYVLLRLCRARADFERSTLGVWRGMRGTSLEHYSVESDELLRSCTEGTEGKKRSWSGV